MITLAFEEEQKSDNCLPPDKQDSLKSSLSRSILPINYRGSCLCTHQLRTDSVVRRSLVLYISTFFGLKRT